MSATVVVAAVHLGCCPGPERCLLCAPSPRPMAPDTVAALVEATGRDRPGVPLQVGFFGGPPPDPKLVASLGVPARIRVRPDLLSRGLADELVSAGVVEVELDALSFDDLLLTGSGRPYGRNRVEKMVEGLRGKARLTAVLAPGLPGSSHAQALRDAEVAAGWFDAVRIHPVLVLADSALRELHSVGRYVPLTLGEAVTTCRAMVELFEERGVEVVRVGIQPKADGYGRAVAGPRHPALRQLVEARRTLDWVRERLAGTPRGSAVVLRCAPAEETTTRGPFNQHIRTLRAEFGLRELTIAPDPSLGRRQWAMDVVLEVS